MSLLALLVVMTAIFRRRIVAASQIAWGPGRPLRASAGAVAEHDHLWRPAMSRRPGDSEPEPLEAVPPSDCGSSGTRVSHLSLSLIRDGEPVSSAVEDTQVIGG